MPTSVSQGVHSHTYDFSELPVSLNLPDHFQGVDIAVEIFDLLIAML